MKFLWKEGLVNLNWWNLCNRDSFGIGILFLLLFLSQSIVAQHRLGEFISAVKKLDTLLAHNICVDSENTNVQLGKLYSIQKELLVSGKTKSNFEYTRDSLSTGNKLEQSFGLMTAADILKHQEIGKDSVIHRLYRKAIEISIEENYEPLICELAKRLLLIVSQNQLLIEEYPYYLDIYDKSAYDLFEKINYKLLRLNYEFSLTRKPYLEEYYQILSTIPDSKEYEVLKARNYRMLGRSFDISLQDYDQALFHHQKAIELYDKNDIFYSRDESYSSLVNKGIILHLKKEYQKSVEVFKEAAKIKLRGDKVYSRVLALDWMSSNYEKLSQLDSALLVIKTRIKLKDSLNHLVNAQNISFLQTKFKTIEKEKEVAIQTRRAKAIQNWLIASLLVMLLGSGVAILFQKNTSKKRQLAEQEALLKQERVDNLLKEQELSSIDAMIAGQEKERQKVAGELHDDLGSLMATIKLHFDNSKVSKKDPSLKSAQHLLEEAYQKIRGIAHNKNSGVMSDQGLLTAIQKMAHTISQSKSIDVIVEDFGLGERLENSLELSIFRMVQELVANAIKHAEASRINIQLTQHEDKLNIIVEDNGKGFEPGQKDKSNNGMGLTTIEKRVEHLEGEFTIDSVVGRGTSIIIDIPV